MLLLALIFYLKYEAPEEEQNFPMVLEMLRAADVNEEQENPISAVDILFDKLEYENPEHIALKYYRNYRSGSAKTLKSIQITLAAARVNAGFTQEDVAKKMGISKQTIINWEKGKNIPGIPEMEMMSKIYNMPQDYIFLPSYSTKSRK